MKTLYIFLIVMATLLFVAFLHTKKIAETPEPLPFTPTVEKTPYTVPPCVTSDCEKGA